MHIHKLAYEQPAKNLRTRARELLTKTGKFNGKGRNHVRSSHHSDDECSNVKCFNYPDSYRSPGITTNCNIGQDKQEEILKVVKPLHEDILRQIFPN